MNSFQPWLSVHSMRKACSIVFGTPDMWRQPASRQAKGKATLRHPCHSSIMAYGTSPCGRQVDGVRPILDERGKKRWELLICDEDRKFQYAQYFPNNKINSKELAAGIQQVLAREGAVKPDKCRYFRGQMSTIISRALADLGIEPLPSRRCFALLAWLEERIEKVYKQEPGYQAGQASLFTLDPGAPEDLPDNLRGERWGFVQLPLSDLQSELSLLSRGNMFGATIPLDATACADLPEDTLIPGVVVFSRRADAIAAWLNGYEVCNLVADADRAGLILETGVNRRWRHGRYARSDESTNEAVAWEKVKKEVRGLHFLVIQKDEEADLSGIWLLQDKPLPSI
ncbi:hypothetical protein WJX84_004750 [Apatococcus fuscideae]|uniref:DUF1092 family protein n=1 Tax=Apatococcus fuscideae TaxID=2026836 RepID=A0AAW1T757_9CHLO